MEFDRRVQPQLFSPLQLSLQSSLPGQDSDDDPVAAEEDDEKIFDGIDCDNNDDDGDPPTWAPLDFVFGWLLPPAILPC